MDFPPNAVETLLPDGLPAIQVNNLGAAVFGHDFSFHFLTTSL
jgi:hypothetical protein